MSDRIIEHHRTMVEDLASDLYHTELVEKDVMHAALGVATEGGEVLDVVKKALFYGRPIDLLNLDEEMGDLLWYVHLYCIHRGKSLADLLEMNERKLRARFGHKWSQQSAENRNLSNEREAMEGEG